MTDRSATLPGKQAKTERQPRVDSACADWRVIVSSDEIGSRRNTFGISRISSEIWRKNRRQDVRGESTLGCQACQGKRQRHSAAQGCLSGTDWRKRQGLCKGQFALFSGYVFLHTCKRSKESKNELIHKEECELKRNRPFHESIARDRAA